MPEILHNYDAIFEKGNIVVTSNRYALKAIHKIRAYNSLWIIKRKVG
jgi:hypothetical protein